MSRSDEALVYNENPENPMVLVKKHKHARFLIYNRPESLNCIWYSTVNIIHPYLKTWENSSDARIIFLSGKSSGNRKVFSAGGDIKAMSAYASTGTLKDKNTLILGAGRIYDMIQYANTMTTPIVALMDGISMGGGVGMITQAPFRIATENTVYSMPEVNIGSFSDCTTTFGLARYDSNLGLYIGLTGHRVYAEDVLFCGLASHFVLSANLEAMTEKLSHLENPTHDSINSVINEFAAKPDHTPKCYTLHGQKLVTIEKCFGFGTVEEILKALQKDGSEFAVSCIQSITQASPTSCKITMEMITRARQLSYNQCSAMEYRIWNRLPYVHDFIEGFGSFSTGKKRRCQWLPRAIPEVNVEDDVCSKTLDALQTHYLSYDPEIDHFEQRFTQYSLPTINEIEGAQSLHHFRSVEKVVGWFQVIQPGKYGVKEKVQSTLERQKKYEQEKIPPFSKL